MAGLKETLVLCVAIWQSAYASMASGQVRLAAMILAPARSAQQLRRRNSCSTQVSFPKHTVFSVLSGRSKGQDRGGADELPRFGIAGPRTVG